MARGVVPGTTERRLEPNRANSVSIVCFFVLVLSIVFSGRLSFLLVSIGFNGFSVVFIGPPGCGLDLALGT